MRPCGIAGCLKEVTFFLWYPEGYDCMTGKLKAGTASLPITIWELARPGWPEL